MAKAIRGEDGLLRIPFPERRHKEFLMPEVRAALEAYRAARERAGLMVQMAVAGGILPPRTELSCVDCYAPAAAYDHRDYSKPLDVEPVCDRCNFGRGSTANYPLIIYVLPCAVARHHYFPRGKWHLCHLDREARTFRAIKLTQRGMNWVPPRLRASNVIPFPAGRRSLTTQPTKEG